MTEVEKVAYAKSFIDKLAVGVDPTNDTPIPDYDVIHNPRLSKCFRFVSEILSKIVDNPRVSAEMFKTSEWVVTPDVLARIPCSSARVSISTVAKRIDTALGSSRKFTARQIKEWLIFNGYLSHTPGERRSKSRPTQKGEEVGIATEEMVRGSGRAKHYIGLDIQAQCFIKDHLDEIVSFLLKKAVSAARKENSELHCWLTDEDLAKFAFSKTPLSISQITRRLNALPTTPIAKRIVPTALTEWLKNRGLLELVVIGNKQYKLPAEEGRKLGISIGQKTTDRGTYCYALYDMQAQHFIVDHILEILNGRSKD